jgi:hypothetical protein
MRENFYIFLDIDGVLWDWPDRINQIEAGNIEKGGLIEDFKPESVSACNVLIHSLGAKYDVTLIISSSWRKDMADTIVALEKNNLTQVRKIEATRLSSDRIRGLEIKEYLKDKPNKDNYLILDDEVSDILDDETTKIKTFIDKNKVIKTDMFKKALTIEQVHDFLHKVGLQPIQTALPEPKKQKSKGLIQELEPELEL